MCGFKVEEDEQYLFGASSWLDKGDILFLKECSFLNRPWADVDEVLEAKLHKLMKPSGKECPAMHPLFKEAFNKADIGRIEFIVLLIFNSFSCCREDLEI